MRHSLFAFSLVLLAVSCKKSDTATATIAYQAKVCFTALHHTYAVPNIDAYLKLNATEFPGWDYKRYDKHITADANGKACFDALPLGTHYIMLTGYDPTWGADVLGNHQITIKKVDDALDITIYVSE